MKLFDFKRIRNRVFLTIFGLKIKYTSFDNFGECNKLSDSHILKIISELTGKEVKSIQKETINVVGDSHTVFFSGQDFLSYKKLNCGITTGCQAMPTFKNYHFGAALAYNATNPNASVNTFEKTKYLLENGIIEPNSFLVTSFGEIDIRVHLFKRLKDISDLEQEIDNILKNYLEYIKMLQSKNIKVIAWAPVGSHNEDVVADTLYPSFGTEQERNKATEIFCKKQLAKDNGFICCSIYDSLVDENYKTRTEYLVDGYHLGTKALPLMIKSFLEKGIFVVENDKVLIKYNVD